MRHFHKLADGIDVIPLINAIQRHPELWNQNTLRTTHPGTPHTEVDDIWIRFNDLEKWKATSDAASILDEHESIWYPASHLLPIRPYIFDLMRRVEGERLGRVLITRMAPGKRIAPHVDGGEHAAYYDRYHLTLQGFPGFQFRAANETVCMRSGECWWFDNSKEHELVNNSQDDRITVIIDIRTLR